MAKPTAHIVHDQKLAANKTLHSNDGAGPWARMRWFRIRMLRCVHSTEEKHFVLWSLENATYKPLFTASPQFAVAIFRRQLVFFSRFRLRWCSPCRASRVAELWRWEQMIHSDSWLAVVIRYSSASAAVCVCMCARGRMENFASATCTAYSKKQERAMGIKQRQSRLPKRKLCWRGCLLLLRVSFFVASLPPIQENC